MSNFPAIPKEIKHVAHFMKVAEEHDSRNVVISYWCRMYACEAAMKSISGKKPPEVTQFLVSVMNWLEEVKKENADAEGIINMTVGNAMVEEYALQLFNYAESQDKSENFGKNMVKAFYTAGILMDVLEQFGPLPDDMFNKRKYAKWKAAYIHNCLKIGDTPFPGPPVARNLLEFENEEDRVEEVAPKIVDSEESADSIQSHPEPVVRPIINYPVAPPAVAPEDIAVPVPAPRGSSTGSVNLGPEQLEKAQKYCKWAGSALAYDDVSTAIGNLQKALSLLQTGKE